MKKLTKKQDVVLRKAASLLRKSSDPDLQFISRHLKGGLEILNYLFEANDAARAVVPKRFEVQPITITSTNKKTMGEVLAARWLLGVVKEQAQYVIETSQAGR